MFAIIDNIHHYAGTNTYLGAIIGAQHKSRVSAINAAAKRQAQHQRANPGSSLDMVIIDIEWTDGSRARGERQIKPRGRPSTVEPLLGMTAAEIALAIVAELDGRAPTAYEARSIGAGVAGTQNLSIVRLDALLRARPEIDAREVVSELAGRRRARRG